MSLLGLSRTLKHLSNGAMKMQEPAQRAKDDVSRDRSRCGARFLGQCGRRCQRDGCGGWSRRAGGSERKTIHAVVAVISVRCPIPRILSVAVGPTWADVNEAGWRRRTGTSHRFWVRRLRPPWYQTSRRKSSGSACLLQSTCWTNALVPGNCNVLQWAWEEDGLLQPLSWW